jgi:hypothetical protein
MRRKNLPNPLAHVVDERVMNGAVRNVNDTMRPELEDAYFGMACAPSHGKASPQPESASFALDDGRNGQTATCGKRAEFAVRVRRDSRHPQAGTARTRRVVRALERSRWRHGPELEANRAAAPNARAFS